MELHESYLRAAYKIALTSKDESVQNGAIIADGLNVLAEGANNFPQGVKVLDKRLQRPAKYLYTEHAERACIFDAAKKGVKLDGLTMYVPWFACADCARAIIMSGIKEVIGHQKPFDLTPERWKESIAVAFKMLDEAGVKHRLIEFDAGVTIRFDGKLTEM